MNDRDRIREALRALTDAGIEWAVLHSSAELPEDGSSDLDIVVPGSELRRVTTTLRHHAERSGGSLVQVIRHESTAVYHVLAFRHGDATAYVKIDACGDYRRDGVVLFSDRELLAETREAFGLTCVGRETELAYFVAKRVLKRRWDDQTVAELTAGYRDDPVTMRRALARAAGFVPGEFEAALGSADAAHLRSAGLDLVEPVLHQAKRTHPAGWAGYGVRDALRVVRRLVRPTGLHVVILGPDGVGKSSVIGAVSEGLHHAFRQISVRHLRPEILPSRTKGEGATEPYRRAPYRGLKAAMKLLYLWADYLVGYVRMIYPAKIRSTLVLYDRYFCDVLVDPVRYRYGGPGWLARAAVALNPSPDLYVVLDADADAIQARKSEMPVERTQELREGYLSLARRWGPSRVTVVSAEEDVDSVASRVVEGVLAVMSARVTRWTR